MFKAKLQHRGFQGLPEILQYAISALLVFMAFLATIHTPLFDTMQLFLPYTAIIMSALFFGVKQTLLATIITILGFIYFFIGEPGEFKLDILHIIEFTIFSIATYWISFVVQSRKELLKAVAHLATTDNLTGMNNRRAFYQKLEFLHALSERNNTSYAIIFMDLDGFKSVNDNFGHDTGDSLLKEVANTINSTIRAEDTASRFGGDEFVILLPDIKSSKDAVLVGEKIRERLITPFRINDNNIEISCSFGIAVYPHHAKKPQKILDKADAALYEAKNSGKNNIKIHTTPDELN